jgi:hypothetical protein
METQERALFASAVFVLSPKVVGQTHRPFSQGEKHELPVGAAQLELAPDKTPDSAPGGRAASGSAERHGVTSLASFRNGYAGLRGKRRAAGAAAHLNASCR